MEDFLDKIVEPQIIQMIPENICRNNNVMPLFKVMDMLIVAMVNPLDKSLIDDLKMVTGCQIDGILVKKDELVKIIDMFYGRVDGSIEIVKRIVDDEEELFLVNEKKETEASLKATDTVDAPIIRIVNAIIRQAIKKGARDIHFEPDEDNLRVKYCIDGVLRDALVMTKSLQPAIISRIKIMASFDISIKRTPQDGRFKVNAYNKDFDVRVSTVPSIFGEKIVMRLLDQMRIKLGLKDLGFSNDCYQKFTELIKSPYGIILVTGPTGSGKTTTLYLALQAIKSSKLKIITIEDPVECGLEGISQTTVNVKSGETFAESLISVLQQEPDVIMVGEMTDLETIDIAVRAALTNHLVFSTIPSNDTASSIARMIDVGIQPYLVTSSVSCVLAQRLVRVICLDCREKYSMSESEFQVSGLDGQPEDYTFFRGAGCDQCSGSGYLGRIGIFELMIIDKELRGLIQSGKSSEMIRYSAQKAGMKTLWEDGLEKVQKGITTFEELKKVTLKTDE
ncbi:MAG: GspE/PulE family protein, partial [Candidatus Omnitrophica bacterium]|nr:GspE/PulE family protein [Candidatus Omnitrophota bacterium]